VCVCVCVCVFSTFRDFLQSESDLEHQSADWAIPVTDESFAIQ